MVGEGEYKRKKGRVRANPGSMDIGIRPGSVALRSWQCRWEKSPCSLTVVCGAGDALFSSA